MKRLAGVAAVAGASAAAMIAAPAGSAQVAPAACGSAPSIHAWYIEGIAMPCRAARAVVRPAMLDNPTPGRTIVPNREYSFTTAAGWSCRVQLVNGTYYGQNVAMRDDCISPPGTGVSEVRWSAAPNVRPVALFHR